MFGNSLDKSEFYSERNSEQIEVRRCLLSLSSGTFVSQFALQIFKDKDIQNYNFACCFYGCETWSLMLREERRQRVFENRVLSRIFGPKRD